MAYYIKARPAMAEELGLTKIRQRLPDGNYLLWQADILPLGGYAEAEAVLTRHGALVLTPTEARQELAGTACAELPEPVEPDETATEEDAGLSPEPEPETEPETETADEQ